MTVVECSVFILVSPDNSDWLLGIGDVSEAKPHYVTGIAHALITLGCVIPVITPRCFTQLIQAIGFSLVCRMCTSTDKFPIRFEKSLGPQAKIAQDY